MRVIVDVETVDEFDPVLQDLGEGPELKPMTSEEVAWVIFGTGDHDFADSVRQILYELLWPGHA